MQYYEVHRDRTCKAIGSKEGYYQWHRERKQFNTMAEVKQWLKEEYGNCKRTKMYRDLKDGTSRHIGYIYHYNTPKVSYDDQAKNNMDWVEILELRAKRILI